MQFMFESRIDEFTNNIMKSIVEKSGTYHGYEYMVIRHTRDIMCWPCGYVKLPENHPYARLTKKRSWADLGLSLYKMKKETGPKPKSNRHYFHNGYNWMNINVHGGLTFSHWFKKDEDNFTAGPWIGWDYSHMMDEMYIAKEEDVEPEHRKAWRDIMAIHTQYPDMQDRHWTAEEIEKHCKDVIRQLQKV